jgi:hypothetical protein
MYAVVNVAKSSDLRQEKEGGSFLKEHNSDALHTFNWLATPAMLSNRLATHTQPSQVLADICVALHNDFDSTQHLVTDCLTF